MDFSPSCVAMASAAFARPSGKLAEHASTPRIRGILATEGATHDPKQWEGIPIMSGGLSEGACGVGGGTDQQDEDCARGGIAML